MPSMNHVTLMGHTGKDVEMRYTADGKGVASFSLATSESWKDKSGNWQSVTEWHNIVVWDPLADRVKDLPKGAMVYVEGKIKTNEWTDHDGVKRRTINIVASRVFDLRPKDQKQNGNGGAASYPPANTDDDFVPEEDDVPL